MLCIVLPRITLGVTGVPQPRICLYMRHVATFQIHKMFDFFSRFHISKLTPSFTSLPLPPSHLATQLTSFQPAT